MKSLSQYLQEGEKNNAAIGHFNVSNLEQLKAVIAAARSVAEKSGKEIPFIIGVSEGEREWIGVHEIAALIKVSREKYRLPVFLNADHTHSLEKVKEAAEADFDAILFDGGKLPLAENIKQTKEAVSIAKTINPHIVVEGELGYIGSGSMILKEIPEGAAIKPEDLTKPEDATKFVRETGIDMLAPAVGNIHGIIAQMNADDTQIHADNPPLDIKRIAEIKKAVGIPLVLHGGSGIRDEDFVQAIKAGISIIHISTELRLAWRKGMEKSLAEHPEEIALYKIMALVVEEMEKVVSKKLLTFS